MVATEAKTDALEDEELLGLLNMMKQIMLNKQALRNMRKKQELVRPSTSASVGAYSGKYISILSQCR